MADVIVNRKELQTIMRSGIINSMYAEYKDFAFMPIPLVIDAIEKEKKAGTMMYSELKNRIGDFPECVNAIPLSSHGLIQAMNDDDFAAKYVNRVGNPIEFATEACVYECEGWWDKTEMLESFREISWP